VIDVYLVTGELTRGNELSEGVIANVFQEKILQRG
jgi:hypothetical protein